MRGRSGHINCRTFLIREAVRPATDILGVSGRAMMQALINGERDPEILADLAKQKLRLKHDALVEALTGRFNEHHAFLCGIILRRIDELSAVIEE